MDRLYNKELKLAYINNYFGEEQTKTTILHLFLKSSDIEKQYNKDVYAFNDKEITSLLQYMKRDNIMSLSKDVSMFKDYVNWCIVNGQRSEYENGENRFVIFQATEDLSNYVSKRKVKNKYLTKEELNDLIDYLANPVDQAIIIALYEFIAGEKLHELRNLTITDVENAKNNNNIIAVKDINGKQRNIQLSHRTIAIFEEAFAQKEYALNNGFSLGIGEQQLADTSYIIRFAQKNKNKISDDEPVQYGSLMNKLTTVKKYTGYEFITANSLRDTRIIHEIVEVVKEMGLEKANDEVFRTAFNNIYKQYDIQFSETQKYSFRRKYEQVITLKKFD